MKRLNEKDITEENYKFRIQDDEYAIPYHYQDLFAPAQSIEKMSIFETIIKYLNLKRSHTILDVGCGDGRFCYFAKNYCNVEGVDLSEKALSWAKVFNPDVKFYYGTIENIDFDKKYNGLVCIEVLEHIPDNQIHPFLNKAKEILKKDGKFIITVPSTNLPLQPKHFRHYNEKDLFAVLLPYFSVKIIGHSRKSKFNRKIMSIANIISLLFFSEHFCDSFPKFVKFIGDFKKKYWYKYLHTDIPQNCYRLIAICSAKGDDVD